MTPFEAFAAQEIIKAFKELQAHYDEVGPVAWAEAGMLEPPGVLPEDWPA